MTTAYLGLGGNIGDPVAAMGQALRALDARPDCRVLSASRLYRTAPWGKTDQPWFVNSCAAVDTRLDPIGLLDAAMKIERHLKRERRERWGPRTIDIDILSVGDAVLRSERLTLPHPRLHERAFVLAPLADLAPDFEIANRTVAEWLDDLKDEAVATLGENRHWWRV